MCPDFSNMQIDNIILHRVYDNNADGSITPPKISDNFTTLEPEGLATLQNRIVKAMGEDSHSIQMQVIDNTEGSTYQICKSIIYSGDNNEKIRLSSQLAHKLARAQNGRNTPGGVLIIISGIIGSNNERKQFVGIIKAELHDGFNIDENQSIIILHLLTSLLLTPHQKFYKIGVFINDNSDASSDEVNENDFSVLVYDHLMNRRESNQLARYFFDNFLGCDYSTNDKTLTRDFYFRTKDFIERQIIPEEEKIEINTSLNSYMRNQQQATVLVADFGNDNFSPEMRDSYSNFMRDSSFPDHAISKDISYLENILKFRRLKFSSDVKIIAPSRNFDQIVHIDGFDDNETRIRIQGNITDDD